MNLVNKAVALVEGDRNEVYGHPADDFKKVVKLAQPILDSEIDPILKHALYMVQVKIARLLNTPDHEDSLVDIIGYVLTYQKILERMNEEKTK